MGNPNGLPITFVSKHIQVYIFCVYVCVYWFLFNYRERIITISNNLTSTLELCNQIV